MACLLTPNKSGALLQTIRTCKKCHRCLEPELQRNTWIIIQGILIFAQSILIWNDIWCTYKVVSLYFIGLIKIRHIHLWMLFGNSDECTTKILDAYMTYELRNIVFAVFWYPLGIYKLRIRVLLPNKYFEHIYSFIWTIILSLIFLLLITFECQWTQKFTT